MFALMVIDTIELTVLSGVLGIVAAGLLGVIAQVFLSYLSQRSLTDIHSLGVEAVVAQNQTGQLADSLDDGTEGEE